MFRFILRYVIFIVILATIQQRITLAYKALCANDRCDVPISEGETTQFYLNAEESFLKLKAHQTVKIFSKSKDKGQNGLLTIELNGLSGYAYSRFVKEIKVLVKSNLLKEIDLPDPKKVRDAAKSDSVEKTDKIHVDQPLSSSQKFDTLNDTLSPSVFGNVPITNENAITGSSSERYTVIDGTKFPLDDFDPSSFTTAVPVISQTTQPYSREAVGDFQPTSVLDSSASLESDDQGKTNFAQSSVNPSLEHFESIQSSAVNNEGLNIAEIDSKSSEVSKEVEDEPGENEAPTFGLFDKVAQTIGGIFGNKEVDNSETTNDDENEEDVIRNSEELPPNLMEDEFRPSPPELFTSLESGSVAATPSNSEVLDVIPPVIPNSAASYVPEPSSIKDEFSYLNTVQSSSAIDLKDDSYSKESKGSELDIDLAHTKSWQGRKLNSENLASEVSETKREIESPKVEDSREVPIRDTQEFENVRNDQLPSKPDKSDEEGDVGVSNPIDKSEEAVSVTEENQPKQSQLSAGERKEDESKKIESDYRETVKTSKTDEISEDAPITNQKETKNLVEEEKPEPTVLPVKEDNPNPTELPLKKDNPKPTELPPQDDPKPTELPPQDKPKPTELSPQDNPKPAESPSQDNPKSAELPPQDDPKPTESPPQDNPTSAEFSSQDNPKPAESPTQDDAKPTELPQQDNPKSAELPPQDEPKSTELPQQDNPKSAELPPQDDPKPTELPPQDDPKSTELPQQDNSKSTELPPQESRKPSELPSQDNSKSTELPSQDNPKPTELKENSANPRELSKEDNLKTPDIEVPKSDGELVQNMKESLPNKLNESSTLNEAENITESVDINSSSNKTPNPNEKTAALPAEGKPNNPATETDAPIEDGKKLPKDELPEPVEEEIISKTTYPYPIPKENKMPYPELDKVNADEIMKDLQPQADVPNPRNEPSSKIESQVEGSIKNLDDNPITPRDKSKFETPFAIESDESLDVEKFEEALKNELFSKDDLEDGEIYEPESSRTKRGEVSNSPFFDGNVIEPPVPPYTNYDEYLQISKDKEPVVSTEESKSDVLEDKAEDSVSSVESVTEPFVEALKNPSSSSDDLSRIDQDLPVVLKGYAQSIIDYIPDPLHSALMDLKSRGLSPSATFLTFSIGLLLVLLITLTTMIKRNNKEGQLLGVLCKTEEKLFKIGTENKILADELERAKTEVGELNENLVKNEEYFKILQEELSQSKNQNVTFTNAVEKLQTQLDGQRNTILTLQSTAEQRKEENRILQESAEEAKRISEERYALIRELEDELNETKNNLKNSEDALSDLRSSSDQLEREKDQLLREAIVWNERVQELMNQLEGYRRNQEDFQNVLDLKQKELDVLNEAIKKVNALDDKENTLSSEQYEELVKKLVNVSQVSLDLKFVTDERDLLKTQLDCEKEKGWLLETKVSEIEKQMVDAKDSYKAALAEKTEAQNKLEVLTNYFKEKEAQLQKELGAQEVMRQQKEYDADSSGRRLLSLMEENETFKSQIISLKKELEDTERSYKNLVATHEKKAHENWLAARGSERKLEEIKREAALLRQRLTLVERDSNESTNSNELVVRPLPKKLITRNGDITLIEQDAGSDLTDASMELDASKSAQFRPLLLPADRPLPPPPAPPPFPMPPFGMPPMPPPPGGPFGVPHPPMMPFHHPDPWRFGHPGMDYEDRVSSRGGRPLSPHSSFSNASRDSRLSSPPPERRRDMFSPNRRMPSSRDSNSPPHLPNFHDLPPHMRGPNFPLPPPPPPPHHLGPPRGPPPPLPPSHYDRNSPYPPAHALGMRNDPHPHLYNDTPPDVRRTDLVTSSPRGNSTQDRDPSKKSSTAV